MIMRDLSPSLVPDPSTFLPPKRTSSALAPSHLHTFTPSHLHSRSRAGIRAHPYCTSSLSASYSTDTPVALNGRLSVRLLVALLVRYEVGKVNLLAVV